LQSIIIESIEWSKTAFFQDSQTRYRKDALLQARSVDTTCPRHDISYVRLLKCRTITNDYIRTKKSRLYSSEWIWATSNELIHGPLGTATVQWTLVDASGSVSTMSLHNEICSEERLVSASGSSGKVCRLSVSLRSYTSPAFSSPRSISSIKSYPSIRCVLTKSKSINCGLSLASKGYRKFHTTTLSGICKRILSAIPEVPND